MKKLLTTLLAATLLGAWPTWSFADDHDDDDDRRGSGIRHIVNDLRQDVDQNTADIQNNATRIQQNADKAAANMEAIQNNAADIADNFSQIQGNRMDIMDLDSRVSALEAGGPPGGGNNRVFVDVDCDSNSNALLERSNNNDFQELTTYNIVGACNGPIYVTRNFVRFVGISPNAAIVLPGGIPNPADGAIFVDGGHDVRIIGLLIDASAWGNLGAQGTDAAGIYARNAFVRVIDTTVQGGLYSINPFRDAVVRLQGTVTLRDFVNSGLSAGDHSLITTRGPVNITSIVAGGNYQTAIEAYRNGIIDLRAGVFVDLPDPMNNFIPFSITATQSSHIRIRSSGNVSLDGYVFVGTGGDLNIQQGSLWGNITINQGGSVSLRNVQQESGENFVISNSTFAAANSAVNKVFALRGGKAEFFDGSLRGGQAETNGGLSLFGTSVTDDLTLRKPSYLEFYDSSIMGNLNGNTIFVCDEETIFVNPNIQATGFLQPNTCF